MCKMFPEKVVLDLPIAAYLGLNEVNKPKALNFCFTGFAGQSMLLLGLAMITFWDSSFLPQGAACGSWENNLCAIIQKDALEELTWMLSSGGQVAFIVIWARSQEDRFTLRGYFF